MGTSRFSINTLNTIHLPPFADAVAAGLASVMPSYHAWQREDGTFEMTLDTYSLTDVLVGQLGFNGMRLSDWNAIPRSYGDLDEDYNVNNVSGAVNAGIDMAMVGIPGDYIGMIDSVVDAVNQGRISEERVNDAARRILRIKVRLDLFSNNFEKARPNAALRDQIWSSEHQALAREAVQKSLVLLKNDGSLPLITGEEVAVAGPFADSMGAQAGGWTVDWQGSTAWGTGEIMGETILTGMQQTGGNIHWNASGDNLGSAGKVVVVIGEQPYAEGGGDHADPDPDLLDPPASVYLRDQINYNVLTSAIGSGKQVVLVIISGRPLIIEQSVVDSVSAIVAAWLPGSRGLGVADVLYGNVNFTGVLPHTWPASFDQIPINVNKEPDENGLDAAQATPMWTYGYGLKY
jgi:beta-glucosidase